MKPHPIRTTSAALAAALAVGLLGIGGAQHAAEAQPAEGSAASAAATPAGPAATPPAAPLATPPATPPKADRGRQHDGANRVERRGGNQERRGGGFSPLTEEQLEEAVALMIELDPSMAPKIVELRSKRPELLRRALTRRFPRLGHMLKLKESRPALYALRVRDIQLENLSHRQARALAALPEGDPAADAARAQLRDTLEQHFTVRQDVRRAEIELLREQLARLEAKRLDEQARRDELVAQRLAQLEAKPPREAGDGQRLRGRRDDDRLHRDRRGPGARGPDPDAGASGRGAAGPRTPDRRD